MEQEALEPHPIRTALLELFARSGTLTATDAARELGGSTGLYSFHLRRLARFGLIEEAPGTGRARPWRLASTPAPPPPPEPDLSTLSRGLEDESYRAWLERKDQAPPRWRRDETFSQVVYLTPDELSGMAEVIRALIAQFEHREAAPSACPRDAEPVAVLARLFPLL